MGEPVFENGVAIHPEGEALKFIFAALRRITKPLLHSNVQQALADDTQKQAEVINLFAVPDGKPGSVGTHDHELRP